MKSLKKTSFILSILGVSLVFLLAQLGPAVVTAAGNDINPGIISWWPGDGDTVDIISSHDGTLTNGATFALGMVNEAFSFDGVDDYMLVPHIPELNPNSEISFEFWARFDEVPRTGDFGDSMFVLEKDEAYIIYWRADGEALEIDFADSFDKLYHLGALIPLPNLQANEFHHYAITAVDQGPGVPLTIRFFVDGVEHAAVPNNLIHPGFGWFTNSSGELRIGSRVQLHSGPLAFDGLIDELSIYNRALTPSEIQSIVDAGSKGKTRKITICHMPGTSAEKTLTIPLVALDGHLGHGDSTGPCE